MTSEVLQPAHWDTQYQAGEMEWDTGRHSTELQRVLREYCVSPCRSLEIGCGTGINAIWLASCGFQVSAVDLSAVAIDEARRRARKAGVRVDFRVADVTDASALGEGFDFFFDRGCYHAVRLADGPGYLHAVMHATRPGALGLFLLGNAGEPENEVGPPVLEEWQVRDELARWFNIVHLRPFRFDARRPGEKRYLGWSCLVRRGRKGEK